MICSEVAERLAAPPARLLLARHFKERQDLGIFATYNSLVRSDLIDDLGGGKPTAPVIRHIEEILEAEFPLLVTADRDYKTAKMTNMLLIKINPVTGKSMRDSPVGFSGSLDGNEKLMPSEFNPDIDRFSFDQAVLLHQQGIEQIDVGLHPADLYSIRES